jgi:hypothetical protein
MRRYQFSLMLFALAACWLLASSLTAKADDAAAAPAPTYNTVQPKGWNFSFTLDANGAFSQPGDAGWTRDDLDFLWLSNYAADAAYPIYQVDGSTIGKDANSAGAKMDAGEFNDFFDKMSAELTKGGTIKILQSSRAEEIGGRTWEVFNVQEQQDDKTLTYYSFFTLDEGGTLRLIDVYYDAPEDPQVYSLATTMLAPPAQ